MVGRHGKGPTAAQGRKTISFDAFVTNVFENQGGQWLLVAHQATPVFRTPE
jgi:hypothetical protein